MTLGGLQKIFDTLSGRPDQPQDKSALRDALFRAADRGETDEALQLAEQWRNIDNGKEAKDYLYRTPVHTAAQFGHTGTAIALIRAGWEIDPHDEDEQTPLMVAISHGRADTVRALIKEGADIHAREIFGQTPLHVAAKEGQADIAQILIMEGADVTLRCKSGKTPLETTFWLVKPDDPDHRKTADRIMSAISTPHAHRIKAFKALHKKARP